MRLQVVEVRVYPFSNKQQKKILLNKLGIDRKKAIIEDHMIIVYKEKMVKNVRYQL